MYKLLTIPALFIFVSANAQKNPRLYINGSIKTLPYIQLYLGADENYQLKIFVKDTLKWQGYNGVYKIKGDSLYLSYHQLYAEPVCQLIDTFHRDRIINLLYIDNDRKVIDTFSWQCANEPILVNHFPLAYRDTGIANTYRNNITCVYYVPDFMNEMNVLFYKPERKVKSFNAAFKIEKDKLIIDPNYKWLIEQYSELWLH
jgi:hypothetical protein